MSITTTLRTAALAAVATAFAASANAATINEWSQPGADFSDIWAAPTLISAASGATIVGGGASGDRDIFAITGLKSGAQQLTLSFSLPESAAASVDGSTYRAGLGVIHRYTPFPEWGWGGQESSVRLDYGANAWGNWGKHSDTLTLALDDTFDGTLYLGFIFHPDSANLNYSFNAGESIVPPVPLPAGLVLMGSGLAFLGGGAAWRRRKAA